MSSSDVNGTSKSRRCRPLRSTIDAAPTTWPPAARRDLHRLARRAAGGQHVLDDEHAIALGDDEPAPQRQRAVLPLGEHRAHAERARRPRGR